MPASSLSRRSFLAHVALASAGSQFVNAASQPLTRQILTFSKPFQNLNFHQTADLIAEVGFDGLECPVRPKGQILPERAEEDLPKMVEALASRGRHLGMLTTDITAAEPGAEKLLRTAKALGISRYRLGYLHYNLNAPIAPQLADLKPRLKDLASLNREIGIQGGYQNHHGTDYVGAPVWDLVSLLDSIDPAHLGICFDIGHATLEGGTSWPIEARIAAPHLACIYVKDFQWVAQLEKGSGSTAMWGPLGKGMVRPEFFQWLRTSGYSGPISLHCEYLSGATPANIRQMKLDLAQLKSWL
jgi:sugar phosphate isomerase/epimerase